MIDNYPKNKTNLIPDHKWFKRECDEFIQRGGTRAKIFDALDISPSTYIILEIQESRPS